MVWTGVDVEQESGLAFLEVGIGIQTLYVHVHEDQYRSRWIALEKKEKRGHENWYFQ